MCQARRVSVCAGAISAIAWAVAASGALGGEESSALELREIRGGRLAETGSPIPREAVRVFVYEGEPVSVRVTAGRIAVSYGDNQYDDGHSGALFDRTTGGFVRRFTVADGWPKTRPPEFAPPRRRWPRRRLVGPGVLARRTDGPDVAAEAVFRGTTFRSMQMPVDNVLHGVEWRKRRELFGAWTPILRRMSEGSYVQAAALDGGARRFTSDDGLAGNIVSHLVAAQGTLWAACVDIYDPKRKEWGVGGLCRFDPARSRWEHIEKIEDRPVRWVTLLQAVHDELWVGFRMGEGVAGDRVIYGMGLYPGEYRPKATALVLARLKDGEWRSWSRAPLPERDPGTGPRGEKLERPPPAEKPWKLARSGGRVILFSQLPRRATGNWWVDTGGPISLVGLETGRWRHCRMREDFGAHWLRDIVAENGEIIVTSDRGAHRWDARSESWRFLETGCPLKNPMLSAATPVGDELWIGYTNQGFGFVGEQGISRYDEVAGVWTHMAPDEIGTACPVRRIIARSPGDVWLLFQPRPWHGAAVEPIRVPAESQGIGRFRDARWEFPAKLDGVPMFEEGGYEGRRWKRPLPVEHLVVIGGKMFVANRKGVYAGPGKWKEIATGDRIDRIDRSEDGKTLNIWRAQRGRRRFVHQVGRYDVETGRLKYGDIKPGSAGWNSLRRGDSLLDFRGDGTWAQVWVLVPTAREGGVAVGPLGTQLHAVVRTRHAVWIASPGELIRLDRGRLAAWIGKEEQE